ncbi:MAG TPA: hypothetical protein VFZ05_03405 [Nitrososphaera sp.]
MREILRLLHEGHEPTYLVAMKEAHQKHESQMTKCFALPRADMS